MNGRMKKAARALLCMQRHSWEQGTAMQAFLECGQMEEVIALAWEAVYRSTEDGRTAVIGVTDGVTDPCSTGEALLRACEVTQDKKLTEGKDALLEWALYRAPRNDNGVVYHLSTSCQFWVDSMYMLPPFLAATGYIPEALNNLYGYWNALFDEKAGLMRHMWDDEKKDYVRAAHWGSGNGWALASMARMIGLLPEGYGGDRKKIQQMARVLLDSLLKWMEPEGLFHDVVDDISTFKEVNLSQMSAYTIFRGVNEGWLGKEYLAAAEQMRKAAERMQNPFGFVENVCGAPTFDKPGISPEGQAFFLLMENAAGKVREKK